MEVNLYYCDTKANVKCKKTECCEIGGNCHLTNEEKYKATGKTLKDMIEKYHEEDELFDNIQKENVSLCGTKTVTSAIEYPSVICNHCHLTDYGLEPVNTNIYNLCEGMGCEDAKARFEADTEDDKGQQRKFKLEELF